MQTTPHSWWKPKGMAYAYCWKCGLVALRNSLTQWCIQHGCEYDEHPDYAKMLRTK